MIGVAKRKSTAKTEPVEETSAEETSAEEREREAVETIRRYERGVSSN